MKNKIKFFLLIIVLISSVVFLGCKKPADTRGTLFVAIAVSPVTLDPRLATDAEGSKIASLVCDGLFTKDEHLNVVPNLVERYEKISDTSYRFFLKQGLVFSNGEPFTADDVVYTYKSITKGNIASPLKSSFDRLSEVVAESPQIVRIDLKEPYAPFFTMLVYGIVSRSAAEAKDNDFGREPVCVGAYKVKNFVPDSKVELVSNPDYFGGAPKLSKLEFQIIKDDNIRMLKLIKGDIDLVQNAIQPMLIESVLKNKNLSMMEDTSIVITYMGLNLNDPILAKEKVRQAIAYAIDRDEIIAHRWKGLALKANSVLSPANWAYDANLKQYPYDPQKAKKLLDEAGLKDPDGDGPQKRFQLLYKTSTVKEKVDTARMIAHQLEKVGIDARVEPFEWGTFFRDVKSGNFQIYTLAWVGVTEPDIFYDISHSSQMPPQGLNRDRYKNPKIDNLVEEGRVTMDESKRRKIYSEVQKILLEDLPFIPLWYEKNVVVYNNRLKGVSLRPDTSYRTFMNIEKR